MHPHRLPQAGRAQERGCGIPKHKRCSGVGLPVPPLSTNHPPAFQFCQVLRAGDREETARAQMGGRRKTKRRSTGWLCPRWKDRGVTSQWARGMPGICPLFSSSGSLQPFRGCVPVPVPLAGTTEEVNGEEVWWGLAYLAVGPDLAPQPSFRPVPLLFSQVHVLLAAAFSTGGEVMRMAGLGNQRQLLLETPPQ